MSTKMFQILDGKLKYDPATTSEDGLMSAADKSKLDGVAAGANKTTVDSALSTTSTNPVQNKVVTTAINTLNTLVGDTAVAEQISGAIGNITATDVGALPVEDYYGIVKKEGNVVSAESIEGLDICVKTRIEPIQQGSGNPSPDNIRPIVGWDSVKVVRYGKNLLNLQGAKEYAPAYGLHFAVNSNGSIRMYGTVEKTSEGVSRCDFRTVIAKGVKDLVKKTGCKFKQFGLDTSAYIRIDETTDAIVFANVPLTKGKTIDINVYVMGYIGDAPTTYEPYSGDTYTATLPETVYSGELDWNTGVLTVNWNSITLDGDTLKFNDWKLPWYSTPGIVATYWDALIKSSHFYGKFSSNANYDFIFTDKMHMSGLFETVDELNNYLVAQYAAGTPVQLYYKLETPYTIQLTPQQITALSGTNTLYTDSGDTVVVYNCPPTWRGEATTNTAGFMSVSDKIKLDGIATGANKTVVDGALSSTSTNPVQNKIVSAAIVNLNTLVGDSSVSSQISTAVENKVDKVNGKELSTNDYTTIEKNKLSGIADGAEVNQNTFSNITIGNTTIFADTKTDTLTFEAGSNVVLTPDVDSDKITIDVNAISNDMIDIICAD